MRRYHPLIVIIFIVAALAASGQDFADSLALDSLLLDTLGIETLTADSASAQPVTILAPLPDSTVPADEPLEISAMLEGMTGMKARLFLDKADITARAEASSDYVYCLYQQPLVPGRHEISIVILNQAEIAFSRTWTFNVAGEMNRPLAERMPVEASLALGWQFADCDIDTTGLGLSFPSGHHPVGEASFYGPLLGGTANGYLSYDPSYDAYPHGMLQASYRRWDVTFGEFYPEFSALAFSGVTPLGVLGSLHNSRFRLDLTAGRTQLADTGSYSFTQYLYGGKLKCYLHDSLNLSGGYLNGYDQASSLADSVRYKKTVYYYTDTIFGFSDTVVTVDSLHPGKNSLYWFGAELPFRGYTLKGEISHSKFTADTGGTIRGIGYLAGITVDWGRHLLELGYSSTGGNFRSVGNPYLETSKNEFSAKLREEWGKRLATEADGSVYKVFSDSSAGNSYRAGAGLTYSKAWLYNLYLRFDYNKRPYTGYVYQSRTACASLSLKFGRLRIMPGYTYSSSSSDRTTQSHTVSCELRAGLLGERLQLNPGGQYYQLRDDRGSSDQAKYTGQFKASWQFTPGNTVEIVAKRLLKHNIVNFEKSYVQNVVGVMVTHRF